MSILCEDNRCRAESNKPLRDSGAGSSKTRIYIFARRSVSPPSTTALKLKQLPHRASGAPLHTLPSLHLRDFLVWPFLEHLDKLNTAGYGKLHHGWCSTCAKKTTWRPCSTSTKWNLVTWRGLDGTSMLEKERTERKRKSNPSRAAMHLLICGYNYWTIKEFSVKGHKWSSLLGSVDNHKKDTFSEIGCIIHGENHILPVSSLLCIWQHEVNFSRLYGTDPEILTLFPPQFL